MSSVREEKKEAIKEYLSEAEVLVTAGRIRLDLIEDSDVSISSTEIGALMEELVGEEEVKGYETSSKGAVYHIADRDIAEFQV